MFGESKVNKILDRIEQFDNFSDFLNSLSNGELHEVGKKSECDIYDSTNGYWYYYGSNDADTIRHNSLWDKKSDKSKDD